MEPERVRGAEGRPIYMQPGQVWPGAEDDVIPDPIGLGVSVHRTASDMIRVAVQAVVHLIASHDTSGRPGLDPDGTALRAVRSSGPNTSPTRSR
ncbi:MAG: hypothetical protein LH603_12545 [Pseudonocardia sp.]|nr:hypothetical protein [Pseudonocardia sp.]